MAHVWLQLPRTEGAFAFHGKCAWWGVKCVYEYMCVWIHDSCFIPVTVTLLMYHITAWERIRIRLQVASKLDTAHSGLVIPDATQGSFMWTQMALWGLGHHQFTLYIEPLLELVRTNPLRLSRTLHIRLEFYRGAPLVIIHTSHVPLVCVYCEPHSFSVTAATVHINCLFVTVNSFWPGHVRNPLPLSIDWSQRHCGILKIARHGTVTDLQRSDPRVDDPTIVHMSHSFVTVYVHTHTLRLVYLHVQIYTYKCTYSHIYVLSYYIIVYICVSRCVWLCK